MIKSIQSDGRPAGMPYRLGGSSSATAQPYVAGSGQAIGLTFVDASGNLTNVSSLGVTNDVQTLEFSSDPIGSDFTLDLGGQTTTPIEVIATSPASYGLYTLPVGTPVSNIAIVASTLTTYGTAPGYTTFPNPVVSEAIDTTGANLIVVSMCYDRTAADYNGATYPSFSDSYGNTWTQVAEYTGTGGSDAGGTLILYYCSSPTVGPGHTFTASNDYAYVLLGVVAVSGASATPLLGYTGAGGYAGSTPSATSIQPGAITPSQNGCLVVTAAYFQYGTAPSVDSGFTAHDSGFVNDGNMGGGIATLIQTSAATVNPTWSWTNGNDSAAVIAVFAPQSTPSVLQPGVSFTLATNLTAGSASNTSEARVDILSGNQVLATATINQQSGTPDSTGTDSAGHTIYWKNLATIIPSADTNAIKVLFTNGTSDGLNVVCDVLRVTNNANSVVTNFDDASSAFTSSGMTALSGTSTFDGTSHTGALSVGGPIFSVNPFAIQSALEDLSNVEAGGVSVTGSGLGPFTIDFIGPMAGESQPTLTTTASSATIAHTVVGGQVPTISINGGSAIAIDNWAWGQGDVASYPGGSSRQISPYAPYALGVLPQSAPEVTYYPFGEGLSSISGYYDQQLTPPFVATSPGPSYSYRPLNVGSESTVQFFMPGLPPATYQLAVTWISQTGLSSDVTFLIEDSSGNTLATLAVDQTHPPADFSDAGFNWKILGTYTIASPINGFGVTISVASGQTFSIDTIQVKRTTADLSVTIEPTDVVTLSIPEGWASTVAGPVAMANAMAVTNLTGGTSLPTFASNAKTMGVGYNVEGDYYAQTALIYSNIGLRAGKGWSHSLTSDVNGYPLTATQSQLNTIGIQIPNSDYHGDGKGFDCAPSGYYTLMWDGASVLAFQNLAQNSQTVVSSSLTGTTNNKIVYNLQPNVDSYSPTIWLEANSTGTNASGEFTYDLRNLRIYPPDPSDPTGMTAWVAPPLFHPSFLAKLTNARCLRFMDALSIIACNISEFSDLLQPGALAGPTRTVDVAVVSISSPTDTPFFDPANWVTLEITTASPHTLFDGAWITLQTTGTIEISDGSTMAAGSYVGPVHVVSPTVIQWQTAQGGTANRTMTNTLTGGSVSINIGSTMVFNDIITLCNEVGADLWLNIPPCASDACVTAMGQAVAAGLNTGLKVHVEYANECWNFSSPCYYWTRALSYHYIGTPGSGENYAVGYAIQSKHVHSLILAAMTAAGRGGDVLRVLGTQGGAPPATTDLVTQVAAYSVPFEELASAPYFDNFQLNAIETNMMSIYDMMTAGQSIDFFELILEYGNYFDTYISQHLAILETAGLTGVKVNCYEGGFNTMTPGESTVNAFARVNAMSRHPRIFASMARFLQKLQDAGCSLINIYYLFGGGYTSNSNSPVTQQYPSVWSTYIGWNQQPGTGNATTDALNISNPNAVNQVKSEVAGAINLWNSLVPGRPTGNSPGSKVIPKMRSTGLGSHGGKRF